MMKKMKTSFLASWAFLACTSLWRRKKKNKAFWAESKAEEGIAAGRAALQEAEGKDFHQAGSWSCSVEGSMKKRKRRMMSMAWALAWGSVWACEGKKMSWTKMKMRICTQLWLYVSSIQGRHPEGWRNYCWLSQNNSSVCIQSPSCPQPQSAGTPLTFPLDAPQPGQRLQQEVTIPK